LLLLLLVTWSRTTFHTCHTCHVSCCCHLAYEVNIFVRIDGHTKRQQPRDQLTTNLKVPTTQLLLNYCLFIVVIIVIFLCLSTRRAPQQTHHSAF
jgi:hypothetical protein